MALRDEAFTLGVEEEYQLIDPQTRALSPVAGRVLPLARETLGEAVQHELMLSQIEIATPVCQNLAEVQAELLRLRGGVIRAAAQEGASVAAAGTHPFSLWQEQRVTPKERYQQLVAEYRQQLRSQVIFGCHVHVGVQDRERAFEIWRRSRIWLPLLLALSGNSPFWQGEDTHYASFRTGLWWSTPMSGPPPALASRAEYNQLIQDMMAAGCLEDVTRIYWDVRLPERFPTIEFRVTDVCMTVAESVMLAGLVRALVRTCYVQDERQEPFQNVHPEMVRAANWRAARYGVEGELIDLEQMKLVPARQLLARFLALLRPALEDGGDWELVSTQLGQVLETGIGSQRQRALYERSGRLEDVVDFVVEETARGLTT